MRANWSQTLSPSEYLATILRREAVDPFANSPVRQLETVVDKFCRDWGGRHYRGLFTAGALEKGMANRSATVIDFVVTVGPDTPYEMIDIQDSLFEALRTAGLEAVRRDVSIAALIERLQVDLIPARQQRHDRSLLEIHARGSGRTIVTDLFAQVEQGISSGRAEEVRLIKLWRDQRHLDFPSYYLELAVIAALRGAPRGRLAENVWQVLGFFEKGFTTRAFIDPTNGTNIVSDELTAPQRQEIAAAAARCRAGLPWSTILV